MRRILALLLVLCSIKYLSASYIQVQSLEPLNTGSKIKTIYHKQGKSKEQKTLNLHAHAAALIDADSGRVLYEKRGNEPYAMASTTKIMTCIVLLEYGALDDIVTFSQNAAKQPDVQLNAKEGEQYIFYDLLFALMLESYNDVAVALAEHVGGTVEKFANLMNKKAKELGCQHTHFVTPNGLDAEEHYSCATDLCSIAAYALQNETFVKIIQTRSYTFSEINTGRAYSVNNKDRFLDLYPNAVGVKTGFTNRAGYCFVGAVKKDAHTYVSAVLGCGWPPNKSFKWKDTSLLMDYGTQNFNATELYTRKDGILKLGITNGTRKQLIIPYKTTTQIALLDGTEDQSIQVEYTERVVAPMKKGATIGQIRYYLNHKLVCTKNIYLENTIREISFRTIFIQKITEYLV